jgi:hypothetical protein
MGSSKIGKNGWIQVKAIADYRTYQRIAFDWGRYCESGWFFGESVLTTWELVRIDPIIP